MDMTVVLVHNKFGLQATIDHHGPSMYSSYYTLYELLQDTFYWNDSTIIEFEMIGNNNSSTACVALYKLIT